MVSPGAAEGVGATTAKDRLAQLRNQMKCHDLRAYYIPSEDAHASEYIAAADGRRAWLSGFTGSAGFAIVTEDKAALWTDGRYFNQAGKQLDASCWQLMKGGLPDTPKKEEWLCAMLKTVGGRVGVDPRLISFDAAIKMKEQLALGSTGSIVLEPIAQNLIDAIWRDRPSKALKPVSELAVSYSGRSAEDKLRWLRAALKEKYPDCRGILISALDEIAWLLNLRGSDIPFNPVFFAFALVTDTGCKLYIDSPDRIKTGDKGLFECAPYDAVYSDLRLNTDGSVLVSLNCNWALVEAAGGPSKVVCKSSPIVLEKAIKNAVELEGFRKCHVRDAVALCRYFSWLEQELMAGREPDEVDGADKLEELRREDPSCRGLSFDTISGSGPNGAVIHYKPEKGSAAKITARDMYLCDSGGQYPDGTTDVTRTLHFGAPSDYERECFTRVLKGVITLASTVFPRGTRGIQLDALARHALWQAGLDYRHGTGHGVGHCLNVHEGPHSISFRSGSEDADLKPGMTVTDEPGYYEDGKFGIRIENVLVVVERETSHGFGGREQWLGFETVTLVPIDQKLIDVKLLSAEEVGWLNKYHEECREKVLPLLNNDKAALSWLDRATQPLHL